MERKSGCWNCGQRKRNKCFMKNHPFIFYTTLMDKIKEEEKGNFGSVVLGSKCSGLIPREKHKFQFR